MIFSWFKDRRRKELLAEPFPAAWREYVAANVRHYAYLDPAKRELMQAVVRVMVAERNWSGSAALTVTDEMKVTVAAQASVLVLGLEQPYFFDRVQSIILYPGAYVRPPQLQRYLNAREGVPFAGEAWYHSPIILSWEHVLQAGRNMANGGNVVLHEFAHYLDGLDGEVDGTPPLAGREQERTWYQVTEAEYRRLVGSAKRHEVTLLDHYGATNKAEFFAVATECFFERPHGACAATRRIIRCLAGLLPARPGRVVARRRHRRFPRRPAGVGRTGIGRGPRAPVRRCRRAVHVGRDLLERRAV